MVAAPAGGLDASRAVALHEADDAKVRAEALLGMRLAFMIASNMATAAGPTSAAAPIIRAGVYSA